MKHKLLNKLCLRVGMIVAVMTTALAGTAWAETVDDVLTASLFTATNSTYSNFSDVTVTSDAVYAGNSAKNTSAIQLRSDKSSSGIVATNSGGKIKKIKVVWYASTVDNRTLSVYGKNTAYSAATDLYNTSNQGTLLGSIVKGTSTELTITDDYEYVGLRSASGAMYLTSITITWETGGSSAVATTTTIDATGIENTDVYVDTAAGSLSATVTAGGSAVEDATVTWSSSDTGVATIDEDGNVTLVAAGTTIITASYAGETGTYQASTATYEMTVTSSAPYVQPTEIEVALNDNFFGTNYGGTASGITDDTPISGTKDNVTITYAGSGNHYVNDSQIRFYPNNKLTFDAPEGYEIKSIVFTSAGTWAATISANKGTYDSSTKTWTGSESSVLFTGSGSSRCDMSQATITIGLPSTDPSISADNVNIEYDVTNGAIEYTINNPVEGGAVSAESSESWLTIGTIDETVPFSCEANTEQTVRTATVTLTYTFNTDETVTKTVIVTQAAAPVIYTTIPELFAAATSAGSTATNVNVTFGDWVVSGVGGSNVFVTDNNGNGFIIYKSNHGFTVNDKLSGTVLETPLKLYNGSAEFTNLTASTDGLSVSNDGVITVITNKTIADLGGVNTGAVITLSNLTYDGTNLSDGTNTIKPYNTLYDAMSFTSGKTYNVTGVYQQYNSTKEILPRSAADIEEVADEREEAGIAFSVEELTITQGDTYTAPTFSNPNNVTVSFATTNSSVASWNNGLVLGGSTGTATITATFDGDDDYKPATETLVVTVNEDLDFATVVVGSNVYQKITSTSELEAGKRYLVVYENTDNLEESKVMNGLHSNDYGLSETTTIADSKINGYGLAATPIVLQSAGGGSWYLLLNDYFLYISFDGNYLYSSENSSTNGTTWTISFENDVMKIRNNYMENRYLMYNSSQPRFSTYKNTQKDVVLYKELPVTLNASGYATFASTSAVDFSDDSEFSAWAITSANKTTGVINFSQITGAVPAGTGVLLKGTAGQTIYPVLATTSATAPAGNLLVGITEATPVEANQYYGLKGDTFKKVNAGTVPAGKALLPASQVGTGVKAFTFNFEDDATGIENLNANVNLNEGAIYNLAGQRLQKMQKGINIVNGKKIAK